MISLRKTARSSIIFAFVYVGIVGAGETTFSSRTVDSPARELQLQQQFSEAAKQVNEMPEIKRLKEDVERAQKAYAEAFEREMATKNPELMEKYKQIRDARIERIKRFQPQVANAQAIGFDGLSELEKKKLSEVRKQAMESPAVKGAKQKRNAAKTGEERTVAEQEYRTTLRNEMLKINKEIGLLLDKLEAKTPDRAGQETNPAEKK